MPDPLLVFLINQAEMMVQTLGSLISPVRLGMVIKLLTANTEEWSDDVWVTFSSPLVVGSVGFNVLFQVNFLDRFSAEVTGNLFVRVSCEVCGQTNFCFERRPTMHNVCSKTSSLQNGLTGGASSNCISA